MTHCVCCDRLLSDYEATLRHGVTFAFLDTCKACLKDVKGLFPIVERKDLITEGDIDDNEGFDDDGDCKVDSGDITDTLMYLKVNFKDLEDL